MLARQDHRNRLGEAHGVGVLEHEQTPLDERKADREMQNQKTGEKAMSDTPRTDRHTGLRHNVCELIHESRAMERELAAVKLVIARFCSGQAWAADSWKDQEHIKPLFDIANHE